MKYVPKELRETADLSSGRESLAARVRNVVGVVVCLGLVYVILGFVADAIAENISEETEARWFSWTQSVGGDGGEERLGRVATIFERLKQQPNVRPLPYRLFLLPGDQPNAAALPGGGVGVTSGLIDDVESEIGLAFVLAHELGHHQHRHALKRLGRKLVLRGMYSLVFGGSDPASADTALSLAESSHSRSQEREADEFAIRLVYSAFGTTVGATEFFDLVRTKSESGLDSWVQFASSHPLTEERIENLRRIIREESLTGDQ